MDTSRRTITLRILEILKKNTNEEKKLKTHEICELMEKADMPITAKTARRSLDELVSFYNYENEKIGYTLRPRWNEAIDGDSDIMTDWYYINDFTDGELRLLIDSVFASRSMSKKQKGELLGKIVTLAGENFKDYTKHIINVDDGASISSDFFENIGLLSKAISCSKMISFEFVAYGTDKKLHPVPPYEGGEIVRTALPYQLVMYNGRYILICKHDTDKFYHYFVDKLTNIKLLERHFERTDFVLSEYIKAHPDSFSGETLPRVRFRADEKIVNSIVDLFGKNVGFLKQTEGAKGYVEAELKGIDEKSFVQWAIANCDRVEVIEPQRVRNVVGETLKKSADKYRRAE